MKPDIGILGATVAAVVTGPLLSGPEFGCADGRTVKPLCAVTTTLGAKRVNRKLDGGDAANTSVSGWVMIHGYEGGIDKYTNATGVLNDKLAVKYKLHGCNGACSVFEVEDNPNFCEEVAIGDFDLDNSAGDVDLVVNANATGSDVLTTDVNTTIEKLFDRPMVFQDAEGRVLACGMVKQVTNHTSFLSDLEGEIPTDMYNEIFNEMLNHEVFNEMLDHDDGHDHVSSEEVGVEVGVKDTSSGAGGMNGVFMVVSAIAAVGIAVLSGDVLAL